MAKTLFDKVWDAHVVRSAPGEPSLIYIDLHLVHEVTSPQAFEGLRLSGRKLRRPDKTFATIDHNIPTTEAERVKLADPIAAQQMETLRANVRETGIPLFDVGSMRQGIVHVIGPELGLTRPGMTIVCGDSHTSTHGAFGALAFGIGTSEVEHVMATQCLAQQKPKSLLLQVNGALPEGVTAKDLALGIMHKWGTEAGTGYVLEFAGESIRKLSMEARMTLCNMSIEFGARAGMVAPDETTFAYLDGREYSPTGAEWTAAVERWRTLATDAGAKYDKVLEFDASALEPFVTWGTTPGMSAPISGAVPTVAQAQTEQEKDSLTRALTYMGLKGGERIEEIPIQRAFIGSCTNGRLEDLRAAARVIRGHKIAKGVQLMVVPGSEKVKQQAEQEGLDRVFRDAGAEWRLPGCSMCLGMNPDILQPGERCAATSNRNFEGRQGRGGRTHLMSPAMVAAAAVAGHFTDVREWDYR